MSLIGRSGNCVKSRNDCEPLMKWSSPAMRNLIGESSESAMRGVTDRA